MTRFSLRSRFCATAGVVAVSAAALAAAAPGITPAIAQTAGVAAQAQQAGPDGVIPCCDTGE
jgi:hypothetical protein